MSKRHRKQPRLPRPEKDIDLQQFITKLQQPGLSIIRVEHDDWCRYLTGRGECNCTPNIKLLRLAKEDA